MVKPKIHKNIYATRMRYYITTFINRMNGYPIILTGCLLRKRPYSSNQHRQFIIFEWDLDAYQIIDAWECSTESKDN